MSWGFLTDNQYNIHTYWYLNRSLWPSLNCIKLLQHASCSWNLSIKPILFRSIWCTSCYSLGPKSAESIKWPSINQTNTRTATKTPPMFSGLFEQITQCFVISNKKTVKKKHTDVHSHIIFTFKNHIIFKKRCPNKDHLPEPYFLDLLSSWSGMKPVFT